MTSSHLEYLSCCNVRWIFAADISPSLSFLLCSYAHSHFRSLLLHSYSLIIVTHFLSLPPSFASSSSSSSLVHPPSATTGQIPLIHITHSFTRSHSFSSYHSPHNSYTSNCPHSSLQLCIMNVCAN